LLFRVATQHCLFVGKVVGKVDKVQDMLIRQGASNSKGFTILELFVIVFIVAVLAMIGVQIHNGTRDAERESAVRFNMRVAKLAAESFATDSGGKFPPSGTDPSYLSYFPGGSRDKLGTKPGKTLVNPFSETSEPLQAGNVVDVEKARAKAPEKLGMPGQIFYSAITEPDGSEVTSYALQATGRDGKSLCGSEANTSLVLSNR
jgi:type II secretory pathway pseudopilin PulG